MTHEPLRQPHKTNYTAVRFTYGDPSSPTVLSLTDWTKNVSLPGVSGGFVSDPSIEVDLPRYSGTLREDPCKITLSTDHPLATALVEGTPHSVVSVEVWSFSESTLSNGDSLLKFYSGIVTRATSNYKKARNRVGLEVSNLKNRLRVALGIVTNHHCTWRFNGFGCRITNATHSGPVANAPLAKTPTSVTRNVIVFPSMALISKHRLVRGYAEYDGLYIGIRDFDPATGTVVLMQEPPASWATASILLHDGCDKQLTTCRDDKLNEANFGGFGYSMPSRHPMLETR